MKIFALHYQSFKQALLQIIKDPLEHLINLIVIALIVSILGIVLILNNSAAKWQKNNITYPKIMVYLNTNANQADVTNIEHLINKFHSQLIKNYQFISKDQGLAELKQDEQIKQIASEVVSSTNLNPLPDMLIINTSSAESTELQKLNLKLSQVPMIDSVQIDFNYAGKISNLLKFISKTGEFLQILFTIVLLLVIYNMVRLQMLLRSDEITVSRLIGASDSFIMRPLVHYAIWQIVFGSTIAFITINCFLNFANNLFMQLNNLFGSGFLLSNLTLIQFLSMLGILIIFTIFAVFLAVQWVFKHTCSK